eukprot:CAMPEP_0118977264 /NCGR_PEP_ID=MMETSP1173-20130426/20944_1 /TAXON_ID=1034831 /ORGANISM="Rhizochromulina marina cf, Strain CCMP1243" /LENGTH=43 /DNA_ID= /DNA_START= /DNA_END= /DNA_ORIENTATION=
MKMTACAPAYTLTKDASKRPRLSPPRTPRSASRMRLRVADSFG